MKCGPKGGTESTGIALELPEETPPESAPQIICDNCRKPFTAKRAPVFRAVQETSEQEGCGMSPQLVLSQFHAALLLTGPAERSR